VDTEPPTVSLDININPNEWRPSQFFNIYLKCEDESGCLSFYKFVDEDKDCESEIANGYKFARGDERISMECKRGEICKKKICYSAVDACLNYDKDIKGNDKVYFVDNKRPIITVNISNYTAKEGEVVWINATANDSDSMMGNIEIYANGSPIGSCSCPACNPLHCKSKLTSPGLWHVYVIAIDSAGNTNRNPYAGNYTIYIAPKPKEYDFVIFDKDEVANGIVTRSESFLDYDQKLVGLRSPPCDTTECTGEECSGSKGCKIDDHTYIYARVDVKQDGNYYLVFEGKFTASDKNEGLNLTINNTKNEDLDRMVWEESGNEDGYHNFTTKKMKMEAISGLKMYGLYYNFTIGGCDEHIDPEGGDINFSEPNGYKGKLMILTGEDCAYYGNYMDDCRIENDQFKCGFPIITCTDEGCDCTENVCDIYIRGSTRIIRNVYMGKEQTTYLGKCLRPLKNRNPEPKSPLPSDIMFGWNGDWTNNITLDEYFEDPDNDELFFAAVLNEEAQNYVDECMLFPDSNLTCKLYEALKNDVTFKINLTAIDSYGGNKTIQVDVEARINYPPELTIRKPVIMGEWFTTSDDIEFNISVFDPNDNIEAVEWYYLFGGNPEEVKFDLADKKEVSGSGWINISGKKRFTKAGEYVVFFRAIDERGAEDSESIRISVFDPYNITLITPQILLLQLGKKDIINVKLFNHLPIEDTFTVTLDGYEFANFVKSGGKRKIEVKMAPKSTDNLQVMAYGASLGKHTLNINVSSSYLLSQYGVSSVQTINILIASPSEFSALDDFSMVVLILTAIIIFAFIITRIC